MTASPALHVVDWEAVVGATDVQRLVDLAVEEDLGPGDVTTDSIFTERRNVSGRVVARTATVACGAPLARTIMRRFDPESTIEAAIGCGTWLAAGETWMAVAGDVAAVLRAERILLNFLMRLCGIATAAAAAANAVPADCKAKIYDTRKTLPGWRRLDKAAVRTGGALNHRFGLFDAVLIKDNHLAATGSIREAVARTRAHATPGMLIEVEVDGLGQLDFAIDAGADIVLLDNFTDAQLAQAVARAAGRVELEASGGVTLE
ncbi:MAG: carboxylating nicotinate-nucleotide diphosphorylase, partial [Myxococcota bacterium]